MRVTAHTEEVPIVMFGKCGWCGNRIYPWTRRVVKQGSELKHWQCWIDRNRKVRQTAELLRQLETR